MNWKFPGIWRATRQAGIPTGIPWKNIGSRQGVVLKDEFDLPNKPCQWTPFDRKYALMLRDPLVKSFGKTLKNFLNACDNADLEAETENLKDQIRKKWAVRIYVPETTIQGLTDFWFPTALEVHASVKDARGNSSMVLQGNENTGFKITRTSFQDNNLIYCESHKIPINIDPSLLTLNDAQLVKNAVWEIVKADIVKERGAKKGRALTIPPREPIALAEVLHCRLDSFVKYVQWFDLKEAGLSFRLIALGWFSIKNLEKREVMFENQIDKKKKNRLGTPIKGEEAVRAGYDLIYRAIFRNSAPIHASHISNLEKYDCPRHGQDCPDDCDFLARFLKAVYNEIKDTPLKEKLINFA